MTNAITGFINIFLRKINFCEALPMKPLVIDGPRMSDVSEQAESLLLHDFLNERFQEQRSILGVHLWTHSPKRFSGNSLLTSLLQDLHERGIPVALQVTVTGLGGTIIEPGIETMDEAMQHLRFLIRSGLFGPDRICLRIDPLQSWKGQAGILTNLGRIDPILEQAMEMEIRRARVSLIAYDRYRRKILPRARGRNLEINALPVQEIGAVLRNWIRKGADIRSCASDLSGEGIPSGRCFDFPWITGLPPLEPLRPVAPRKGCLCFVPESVRLWKVPRRSSCSGGCLACYAQDHE